MIYVNEFDAHAAEWLRELSRDRLIPEAHVDGQSIKEVQPEDLDGFDQCHFFGGIGGWCEALRLAGWEPDRPVWTGSCPCQPFSSAGKGLGTDDPRHLWPDFLRLIAQCRPAVVFGEQVASAAGREWLAGVRIDLEALGYAVGCADLCAAGVGAPHLRQRLYWVAHAQFHGQERVIVTREHDLDGATAGRVEAAGRSSVCGRVSAVADADGWHSGDRDQQRGRQQRQQPSDGGPDAVGNAHGPRLGEQRRSEPVRAEQSAAELRSDSGGLGDTTGRGQPIGGDASQPWGGGHALGSGWSRFDVILCRDGKRRRIPAGTQPLVLPVVDGVPISLDELWGTSSPYALENAYPLTPKMSGRVGLLRGAGNAIVPQVAAVFIRAFMKSVGIE